MKKKLVKMDLLVNACLVTFVIEFSLFYTWPARAFLPFENQILFVQVVWRKFEIENSLQRKYSDKSDSR